MLERLENNAIERAEKFANVIAQSAFVPPAYRNKPADVMVCILMGYELGLQPLQALQSIAVINGKPSVYGDAAIALCRQHPECEYIKEWTEGEADKIVAYCECKRRGQPPEVRQFDIDDAKKANLWGKAGPWTQYPKRMLQMRARGFALRDVFADALKGMITREEAEDYPRTERVIEAVQSTLPPKVEYIPTERDINDTLLRIAVSSSDRSLNDAWQQVCELHLHKNEDVVGAWCARRKELKSLPVAAESDEK